MPKAQRTSMKYKDFGIPVSYRIAEGRQRLRDARNVISYQGRLDTRFGYKRFMASAMPAGVQSISFYKQNSGVSRRIIKCGTSLYSVDNDGNQTLLKTGLTAASKHRGLTLNGRHIIAVEGDGHFQYDGTTFSIIGQAAAATPPILSAAGSGTFPNATRYKLTITYYSTTTGFETNESPAFTYTTVGANVSLRAVFLAAIDWTVDNAFIDKIRIYLQDVTNDGDALFVAEIDIPTPGVYYEYVIDDPPTSTQTPPTTNGPVRGTQARYMALFNNELAINIGEYSSEVYFSEQDLPDAYDDTLAAKVLTISGNGPVTALATGLYNGDSVSPYLIVFKRKSTHLYTEAGASPVQVQLSDVIGCVSHDTIFVKNGDIYFLSEVGWRVIRDGKIVSEKGDPITLGMGDIDDIFIQEGFEYEVNRSLLSKAFSCYYEPLDHYMTWVAEGVNTAFSKCYVYEFDTGGFKPFEFAVSMTAACAAEDNLGRDCILMADSDGYLYQYSIKEARTDKSAANADTAVDAWAQIYWTPFDGDYDATYNFRELIVRAMASEEAVTVKTWLNFNLSDLSSYTYDFPNPETSFVLDESILDTDTLGDSRGFAVSRNDINRVGESILIEFSQEIIGQNMGIISAQLDASKNGNRNVS